MSTQERINAEYLEYLKTDVWKEKARQRLEIDKYKCQGCGCEGTQTNPLNVHHFGYREKLGNENVYTDLVSLCRSCHILIHKVMNRATNDQGRRGWRDVAYTPNVHTYTADGEELERTKEIV